ncbi:nitrate/nitrite transporter NrtS [uncultured Alteromonas sp.]|jgi:methyl-accepting chemotaxis protein|uniref:nitrate/nitrite transporter NrtS n=1 Tax=uncultured Alteromonas sp. TaxID=179113 RepID=UPI0025F510CB|nr:nitrate/nitrite transporter NrtS [uncultured Alteromonas sp.]
MGSPRKMPSRSELTGALKTATVVGSVLVLINQYEAVMGQMEFNLTKAILSYCVPFSVYLYGRLSAASRG